MFCRVAFRLCKVGNRTNINDISMSSEYSIENECAEGTLDVTVISFDFHTFMSLIVIRNQSF